MSEKDNAQKLGKPGQAASAQVTIELPRFTFNRNVTHGPTDGDPRKHTHFKKGHAVPEALLPLMTKKGFVKDNKPAESPDAPAGAGALAPPAVTERKEKPVEA